MLTYTYRAKDPISGKRVTGNIQADNESAASKALIAQHLTPLEIKARDVNTKGGLSFLDRIRTKDKIIFSRQLSTLINAGVPLVQSLRNVMQQTSSKKFQAVMVQVITSVESGSTFAAALAKHPKVFNRIYTSLIAAGEASGTLDQALERLATQQEKDAELTSKVRGAMVYPFIVLLVMGGVVGFMVVAVLPQVENLYKDTPGLALPLVTRILLGVSHFTIHFWWLVLVLLLAAGVFGARWGRTLAGRRVFDKIKMRAPLFGQLFMKIYMARFSRTATTLVASGVPMIQMLEITAEAVDNVHVARSLHGAQELVKGGKALSLALQGDPNFLPLVPNMIQTGEQSGALETMLGKVADYYEKEVDTQVKTISTIIEPALMVILGVVAFIIVAAILLPIYSLVGKSFI